MAPAVSRSTDVCDEPALGARFHTPQKISRSPSSSKIHGARAIPLLSTAMTGGPGNLYRGGLNRHVWAPGGSPARLSRSAPCEGQKEEFNSELTGGAASASTLRLGPGSLEPKMLRRATRELTRKRRLRTPGPTRHGLLLVLCLCGGHIRNHLLV